MCLKYVIFQKKNCQTLGVSPSKPRNLTHTNCTATKRSNFVAQKNFV